MNFQFYLERLHNTKDFQKFLKENKKAYPCSAFFVINKENPNEKNQQHFDYYIPSTNKMFSFKLEEDCQRTPIEERDYFIGTVFISSMGIISLHIDIEEKKVILFEKRSFFDMIKIIKK